MARGVSVALALSLSGLASAQSPSIRFTDITRSAGIRFQHNNGAFGQKYLPETMGSGVAVFDADGDGDLDIYLVNGRNWPGRPSAKSNIPALYIQDNGRFSDRTRRAGLAQEMYGMGAAAADYDNDGDTDLYVTCLDDDYLFRNEGDGRFVDVTRQAGIRNPAFSTSAAWLDYDRDGLLDLYVCNYVEWSIETDIFCTLDGVTKSYCTPESYKGVADRLYRNNGNGAFTDTTQRARVHDATSKSLGVVAFDYNDDGWPDLFVANDTQPNKLYENQRDGTFEEVGMLAGVAFDEAGVARGAMGTDAADFDRSGRFSLVVGNFANEMLGLYRNEGNGLFIDVAPQTQVGRQSLLTLAFGCFFFDADGDGWQDIFVANGHVENEINRVQRGVFYRQAPHLFWNAGGRNFRDVAAEAGLTDALVGRGAAYGDFDGDGDLDVVVTECGGAARVYRNDTPRRNLLRIRLVGRESNRDAVGAKVVVRAGSAVQRQIVRAGSSYCSQSELTLTFGLGDERRATQVEVVFPSGRRQFLTNVAAGQTITVAEGRGIVASRPFARGTAGR